MVFFNYSTMQMAAKIVYYGPGLCGKTTNLQQIYNKTASDSRGEMVSLETETDRTLFFDLLPIDVGTIGGFSTRIQLYTVPGQVFYNTTRKLVLKGVDGVVFVADSQKPMLQANVDSLRNLQENLAEMGVDLTSLPVVLQFNKRDLPSICTADELNQAMNWHQWPYFEASAVHGQGVFETLKGISKLTLIALKKKLARGSGQTEPAKKPRVPAKPPVVSPPVTGPTAPVGASSAQAPPAPTEASPQPPPPAAPAPRPRPQSAARHRREIDVLGELEKLRREVQKPDFNRPRRRASQRAPSKNGHSELHREIQLSVDSAAFAKLRRLSFNLEIKDEENRVLESIKDFQVELQDPKGLEKLLLKLSIALHSKG